MTAVTAVGLPRWEHLARRSRGDLARVWPDPAPGPVVESILVATVQSRTAYTRLAEDGLLSGTWSGVPEEFTPAYRWMAEQMTRRGIGTATAPVWLWVRLDRDRLADDLALCDPDDAVLLVAEVPRSRCLVSAHEGWHYVLNESWCPAPGGVDDAYDHFEAAVVARTGQPQWRLTGLPEDLRRTVETSWGWCLIPELWPGSSVQAVSSYLLAAEVLTAVRLA